MAPAALLVITAAGSEAEANRIAETIIERRLAACVNIVPSIRSIYRWKGAVARDDEWLLLIKTLAAGYDALAAAIRETHSYELPEILAFAVERGEPNYLAWLGRSLENDEGS